MKFLCTNCNAKYQIDDDKIVGRTLRMKCRKCEHQIVINGEGAALDGSRISNIPPAPSGAPGQSSPRVTAKQGSVAGNMPKPAGASRGGSNVGPFPQRPRGGLGADFKRQLGQTPATEDTPPPAAADQWHVAINDVPVGPMKREELARKVAAGAVTGQSLCWREGFDDWRPLAEVPELAALIRRGHGSVPPPRGSRTGPGRGLPAPQGRATSTKRATGSHAGPVRNEPMRPAARSNVVPIGGRVGAGLAVDEHDWGDDAPDEPTQIAMGIPEFMQQAQNQSEAMAAVLAAQSQQMAQPIAQNPFAPPVAQMPAGRGIPTMAWVVLGMVIALGFVAVLVVVMKAATPPQPYVVQAAPAPVQQPALPMPATAVQVPTQPQPVEQPLAQQEETSNSSGRRRSSGSTTAQKTQPATTAAPTQAQNDLAARFGDGLDTPVGVHVATDENTGPRREPLDYEKVSSVVNRNKPNLQRCYEASIRGMREPPTVRLNISIMVGESGTVTRARAEGGTLTSLNSCIESQVRRWRFPANQGGAELPPFPVVFQPGG